MAVNPYWPLVVDQIAFTGDPNDPNATPTYSDVTARVRSFEASRGRQYEIDQNQTGEAHLVVSDSDEVLNPANTSAPAPFAGNIKPYRRYLRQAQWPPTPITTADSVTFRQVTSTTSGTGTASSFTVQLPADIQVGDDLLLAVATCGNNVYPTVATSWIPVHGGTTTGSGSVSLGLWRRSVTAADIAAGSVTGTWSGSYTYTVLLVGVDLKLGQNACYTVVAGAGVVESVSGTSHTTPSATVGYQETALLGIFVEGDPSPGWSGTQAAGDTILARVTSANAVGNNASVMVTASPLVGPGTYTRTATTSTATVNALMSLVTVSVDNSVNLLNAQAIPTGYDPDFETTAVGGAPPNLLSFNVNPKVQAANPYTGFNSLQWSVSGTSEQVAGFTIPCIPGRAYVTSCYYRQTAANTGTIFINGGAGGTTTTATGSYVRLSVAYVATQPTHQVFIGSYTPTLASTVNVDAIQHEQLSALNANPTFETGTGNWTAHGGTATSSTRWQQAGARSMLLTPDGVSASCYAESEQFPVTPNARYLVAGFAYAPNAVGSFAFAVRWYDSSHNLLSTSSSTISLGAGSVTERDDQFTAPASAAYATVAPTISGTPPTSQQVYVDNVALYSATPTTASTTGPVIYTPFAGYVERWPSSWNHQGTYGLCQLACVDSMATLAGTDLHTEFRSMLLSKAPDYWWPLSDGSNTTTFTETSGNGGVPLSRMDANGGAPTFAPGTQVTIAGDPGATGVTITGGDPTVMNGPETVLASGIRNTPLLNVGSASKPFSISVLLWLSHNDIKSFTTTIYPILICDSAFANALYLTYQGGSTSHLGAQIYPANGSTAPSVSLNDSWGDQKPHMIVITATIGTSTGYLNLFIDGVQVGTSGSQDTSTWVGPFNMGVVQIGGGINPLNASNSPPLPNGIYDHFAIWNRELSAQDVTDLWTAAGGYPGETSGARISRLLSIGGYTGPSAIDTGQSTMDVSTVTEGQALLDACQAVTLSENGNLYVEAGTVTAKSRTDRYLKTTATWVFGENPAGGEYPYEADIAYDYDPSRVVNDVTVTRVNGARANATDATSQKQYFRRSYQRTVGIQSDLETIDAANYLLNKGKQPIQRVSRLSIKPSANPALWPVALGARIGDRVTVKRRTPAFTMSADFFIEKIEHDNEAGSWVTNFEMSPADRSQVWILGDATYGQLGITTVLGF